MVFSVYSCVLLLFMSRRPTTQKKIRPRQFQIRPNPAKSGPDQIWQKIISGATLLAIHSCWQEAERLTWTNERRPLRYDWIQSSAIPSMLKSDCKRLERTLWPKASNAGNIEADQSSEGAVIHWPVLCRRWPWAEQSQWNCKFYDNRLIAKQAHSLPILSVLVTVVRLQANMLGVIIIVMILFWSLLHVLIWQRW